MWLCACAYVKYMATLLNLSESSNNFNLKINLLLKNFHQLATLEDKNILT